MNKKVKNKKKTKGKSTIKLSIKIHLLRDCE